MSAGARDASHNSRMTRIQRRISTNDGFDLALSGIRLESDLNTTTRLKTRQIVASRHIRVRSRRRAAPQADCGIGVAFEPGSRRSSPPQIDCGDTALVAPHNGGPPDDGTFRLVSGAVPALGGYRECGFRGRHPAIPPRRCGDVITLIENRNGCDAGRSATPNAIAGGAWFTQPSAPRASEALRAPSFGHR
jgi:hypothetical protein